MHPYPHGRVSKQTLIYNNICVAVREILAFPTPQIFHMQVRNFTVKEKQQRNPSLLYLL